MTAAPLSDSSRSTASTTTLISQRHRVKISAFDEHEAVNVQSPFIDAAEIHPLLLAHSQKPVSRPPLSPSKISTLSDIDRPPVDEAQTPSEAIPRPSLATAVSSTTLDSQSTQSTTCLPAADLFDPHLALPLVLPHVDRGLDELAPTEFTPLDSEDLPWGREERKGWEDWCGCVDTDRRKSTDARGRWWSRWLGVKREKEYVDLDKAALDHNAKPSTTRERQLLLPPFHLLPANVTLTDLKLNKRKPDGVATWQDLFGTSLNALMALAGSSWGVGMTTVEMWRDLMQCVPAHRSP